MNTPTLAAPGIVLRPLSLCDAPALFVALSDPEVQLYRRLAPHRDVAETERYIEDTLTRGHGWAITENGDEALGRLALRVLDGDTGEFGIVLRRATHRRGFAKKALALAETFAFTTLNLRALRAQIDSENAASLSLFTGAGFKREQIVPQGAATHRGARDNIVMGKVSDADFRTAP